MDIELKKIIINTGQRIEELVAKFQNINLFFIYPDEKTRLLILEYIRANCDVIICALDSGGFHKITLDSDEILLTKFS